MNDVIEVGTKIISEMVTTFAMGITDDPAEQFRIEEGINRSLAAACAKRAEELEHLNARKQRSSPQRTQLRLASDTLTEVSEVQK
jgi:hypothetical protein